MDIGPMDTPVWAITGVPGAGKSTLARELAKRTGRTLIRTHDLAVAGDPSSVKEGRLADGPTIATAFVRRMDALKEPAIIDGWPRTPGQLALLPPHSLVFRLWCSREVTLSRLLRRGREDDTEAVILRRYDEQDPILNGEWLRAATTHTRSINTSRRSAEYVIETFWLHVTGKKREIY